MPPYRMFDHTADMGIEWEEKDLPALFRAGAEALAELLVDPPGGAGKEVTRTIEVGAMDLPDLMVRFLHELLFLFETRREVFPSVRVEEVTPGGEEGRARLRAEASGRLFDPEEEEVNLVIKAVTYHELDVSRQADGTWRARVIFDV